VQRERRRAARDRDDCLDGWAGLWPSRGNVRADLVGRALRLIADGVVERDGVAGLARRLGCTERHVHRLLVAEVGCGARALARSRGAQTARLLLETTALPLAEVAVAAGFASPRQLDGAVREAFRTTPAALRAAASWLSGGGARGSTCVRLPYRPPLYAAGLLDFLAARAVPGVEEVRDGSYVRSLRLPHGSGTIELTPQDGHVRCALRLDDLRDLGPAVHRARRLLDLDADAVEVDAGLGADPLLRPLVAGTPGRRLPGTVDGPELAIRAVLGQQVSVAGARTLTGRLVARYGTRLAVPIGTVTHLFPSPEQLAAADPADLPLPRRRARTLTALAAALARGSVTVDDGADRAAAREALLALPGVGAWTADYVAMRALGDPDVFLPTDLGVRRALRHLGQLASGPAVAALAERWRPWRSYALLHLWAAGPRPPARPTPQGSARLR